MASSTNHLIPLLLLLSVALTTISVVGAAGITIDLIHRDSPRSPLSSNSAASHMDKLYGAIHRSILRAREIARATRAALSLSELKAPVIPAGGEYLVDISIGTPPSRFLGIVDTGSDLTWTQCKPCVQCYAQDIPVFDPAKSKSYATLPCDSNACSALPAAGQGCSARSTCAYKYGYGDKSSTLGDLATETLTLGSSTDKASVKKFAFGCGHENQGTFRGPGTGLVGLGQGPLSLTSQTKSLPEFGGKFSYCLIPFEGALKEDLSSKLSFGDNAIVSGADVVSTPVLSGEVDTFYYLTLESISVGGQSLPFKKHNGSGLGPNARPAAGSKEGNIIIDSGTTLTMLPQAMFDELVSELKSQIKSEAVPDPESTLELCFQGDFEVPKVTFHFAGADLELGANNIFLAVASDVYCLSMLPAEMAIFGNLAQMNIVVGHDLDAKTVSFKPTDCSKYV